MAPTSQRVNETSRDYPPLYSLKGHLPTICSELKFDPAAAGLDIHPGRFTRAVEDAMAAEGLPLRFYQSAPVPAQMVFKLKEGFGMVSPGRCQGQTILNMILRITRTHWKFWRVRVVLAGGLGSELFPQPKDHGLIC